MQRKSMSTSITVIASEHLSLTRLSIKLLLYVIIGSTLNLKCRLYTHMSDSVYDPISRSPLGLTLNNEAWLVDIWSKYRSIY